MVQQLSTCGTAATVIHFERSGVKVSPFELNVYKDKGKLDHARAKLSREAGDVIDDHAKAREPVSIYSDDTKIVRLMFPDDGIELGDNESHLELHDELQLLQYVEIDKTFSGNWVLEDIVDYVYERVKQEDDKNIFESWKESEVDVSDYSARTQEGSGGIWSEIPVWGDFRDAVMRKARDRYTFLKEDAELDFDGDHALHVVKKVSEVFEIDIFTKDDGVIYVGSQQDDVDIHAASMDRGTYNLVDYSVPAGNNALKGVIVEGQEVLSLRHDNLWQIVSGQNTVYMHGIAIRNDIEDGNFLLTDAPSRNPDVLEQVAENNLRSLYSNNQGGTARIDLLSTGIPEGQPDIRHVEIDDALIIPKHYGRCQNIVDGSFFITSIHHKMNPMDGWIIELGIDRMVIDNIDTAAFGYDTKEDKIVEDIGLGGVYWGDATLAGIKGEGFNIVGNDDISDLDGDGVEDEL